MDPCLKLSSQEKKTQIASFLPLGEGEHLNLTPLPSLPFSFHPLQFKSTQAMFTVTALKLHCSQFIKELSSY